MIRFRARSAVPATPPLCFIDGSGLIDFFDRLRELTGEGLDDILSVIGTHPASGDRSEFVRTNTTASGPAMSDAQWNALKGICGTE